MSKLFPNYIIDLENGTVFSLYSNRLIATNAYSKNGYHGCEIHDCFNNLYKNIHEVIIAEGLQIPKHLWPIDENGKRFVTDHIVPISNGGTDSFENLHLIPKPDNNRNPFTRINQAKAQYGKHLSEETKKKISENNARYMLGKHHSEETKKKISEANSGENNRMYGRGKEVYQYNLNGELVAVWKSTREAEKNGYHSGCVSMCCNGKLKSHKGYKWSYKPL